MLKAVIFDMDGVIIDSEPLHAQADILALKKYGVDVTTDYCNQFIGSTDLYMMETVKKDFKIEVPAEELVHVMQQTRKKLVEKEGYPKIPYVDCLIKELYESNILLAIASSAPMEDILKNVEFLGIKKYFHAIISGCDVEHPKPAPDIFIKAAKELDIDPSECVVFEDSYNGVTAAKSAGMTRIGFLNPNSGKQDLSHVNFVIEGFEEINLKFISQVYQRSKGNPVTIASTRRLIIRELTVDDIKNIYQIYQAPAIRQYVDDIDEYLNVEIEKHKAYIKNVYSFYGYGYWGVFSKDNGTLIGRCGIQNNEIDGRNEIELGYLLDVKHWGYGYAIECTKAVLEYAFHELSIPRVVAVIDKLNDRSVRVAEYNGMKIEKEIIYKNRSCYLYFIESLKEPAEIL